MDNQQKVNLLIPSEWEMNHFNYINHKEFKPKHN